MTNNKEVLLNHPLLSRTSGHDKLPNKMGFVNILLLAVLACRVSAEGASGTCTIQQTTPATTTTATAPPDATTTAGVNPTTTVPAATTGGNTQTTTQPAPSVTVPDTTTQPAPSTTVPATVPDTTTQPAPSTTVPDTTTYDVTNPPETTQEEITTTVLRKKRETSSTEECVSNASCLPVEGGQLTCACNAGYYANNGGFCEDSAAGSNHKASVWVALGAVILLLIK
ncbi:hypothetical protein MAR_012617 [Mya arenaria]|uniref:EGF-like domain-containing protein n=1 Tax=Mya arenaria TaxID=6604 RepID=A0ABY7FXH2_MYAAR|nr:hypothetical protein MAR_012617 [Mya arenaria]